ncbi:MAG: DNA-processing protein DprA [Rhodospirillaceae bacterium]|nr:DNA-processing protein DprA [Rhodospirillaceae bacterium]
MARFGSAGAAIERLPDLAHRAGRGRRLAPAPREAATELLATARKKGFVALAMADGRYPALLAQIDDAPPVLWVKGDAALLGAPCIGMVGARNASLNGRRFAAKLAADLARSGLVVVSGLARGIDGAAHDGALSAGRTVAVLAGGPDVIYPPEHAELWRRIADTGAIVSEMPLGTEPLAAHFPRRNRIISGLSRGVVVVEATPKSGSLITARYALDQDREVLAVPGSPLDPRAHGPNGLIRDGATLVQSADDVVDALAGPPRLREGAAASLPQAGQATEKYDESDISAVQTEVEALLGPTPVGVDELVRQCQVSAPVMAQALMELELAGRIERLPGNRVAAVGRV